MFQPVQRIKYDASFSGDRVQGGLRSDNCVKYYLGRQIMEAGNTISVQVEKKEDICKEGSKIIPEYAAMIEALLDIPGVQYVWVYPYAIHIHKYVIAEWKTMAMWETMAMEIGIHNLVLNTLRKHLATDPDDIIEDAAIAGCDFPA